MEADLEPLNFGLHAAWKTEEDCLVPSHENGNAPTGCRPLKKKATIN